MKRGTISIRDVSKTFRRASKSAARNSESGMAWGLREVSIEIAPGEVVGIIGVNGSGKSTLLRIVGDITAPSSGSLHLEGRVSGILALGDGFHPLFTGRENAITGAMLVGMTRAEVADRLEAIIDFAEVGDAIDDPIRTYSTGMIVRLAYSVAVHVSADIVLIDEALAVGDGAFAAKCFAHLDGMRARGTTILIASHDLVTLRKVVDRGLWINGGRLLADGDIGAVIDRYESFLYGET